MFSACTPGCCFFLQSCWNVQQRGFTVSNWGAMQHKNYRKILLWSCRVTWTWNKNMRPLQALWVYKKFLGVLWSVKLKVESQDLQPLLLQVISKEPREWVGTRRGWVGHGWGQTEAHRHYPHPSGGRGSGMQCTAAPPRHTAGLHLPSHVPLASHPALLWRLSQWECRDWLFLKEIGPPDLRLCLFGQHSLWNSACLSNCNHMWNQTVRDGWMCLLNYIIFWLSIVNYAALWNINLVLCMGALMHFLWHFTMKLVNICIYLKASV